MEKRFVSIWFRYLVTDWFALRRPQLAHKPFVVSAPSHGKMIVTAVNAVAEAEGIYCGMAVADARAILSSIEVLDDKPGLGEQLLKRIAEWCIRFTPSAAIDLPNGIMLDASGCSHLWGGEQAYINDIVKRFSDRGYHIQAAMANTIGTAWAVARYGKGERVVSKSANLQALESLPPMALRVDATIADTLNKLGLRRIGDIINMPPTSLRRRFGPQLLQRIHQAIGVEEEFIQPVIPIEPYHERLPCLEPIVTATGIDIALRRLLESLCNRLVQEQKGIRMACLKCYRVDGKIQQVDIATIRASYSVQHLFKLFEEKLRLIEPGLGIELFALEAPKVEDHAPVQEKLWQAKGRLEDTNLAELLDRLAGKLGANAITRFLPDEHYWPERSVKPATSLQEKPATAWVLNKPRPIQLLAVPEQIDVMAIVPDNPPVHFRYKGKLHKVIKADGPERIEQEWWIEEGRHRDYYAVEDEAGCRYWVFRLGHYTEEYKWFIHGFFG